MRLEGGGDFVGRLQRLVDGPVPRGVVDHMASILRGRPALQSHITVAHYSCGMAGEQAAGRVDSWIWSVRLTKTRSVASDACRGGHVKVNGMRVKPAQAVRAGDEVRLRQEGHERVVIVVRVIAKRVSATVAAECYIDNSPPPPREETVAVGVRDRGAGRPTKRERRSIEKLLGRPAR
jgi:ribosome-associated heat shock protein Hsp15